MRSAKIKRATRETQIFGQLEIEGQGRARISTGIRFLDHMLELFTRHGGFDLELAAKGDLDVDQHHTVEDVGIVLGQLFDRALGKRVGINRAGYFVMPMDETLAVGAVDLGGRALAILRRSSSRRAKLVTLTVRVASRFFRSLCAARAGQPAPESPNRSIKPS